MVLGGVALAAALTASPAGAVTGVLADSTMARQPIPCAAEPDGVRVCAGRGAPGSDLRLESFDGTPLSLFVTLPPVPASGADGGYPLVVQSHGWGAPPSGPDDAQYGGPTARKWALDGYAVLQFAARGWGGSCGTLDSRALSPAACLKGYIRLDDYRYEARDVQNAIGLLVDEGIADPNRIGLNGESYGGGVSLAVATLNDRVMNPDGTVGPWRSPKGTPLRIAAAAPFASWSDLAYSLAPNGRTLDSRITSPTDDLATIGVQKLSIMSGLYTVGTQSGFFAPTRTDPEADATHWYLTVSRGAPYDADEYAEIARHIAQYRSPYYLLQDAYDTGRVPPPPLFLANGFTDDVFPADEMLRYYNLARKLYPSTPMSLFFFDGGHQRASNKPVDAETVRLAGRIHEFFDHYVKGTGPQPPLGATAMTQTCPSTEPSGGPFHAATWADLHPGEVTYTSEATQPVDSLAGDPTVSQAFDPVAGGLACTTAPADDQGAGVATYRLPTPTGAGYTLLGAPTIRAELSSTAGYAYLAGRLLDVDPETNRQTLVARGLYRLDPDKPGSRQEFQLHANGWHFAPGHIPKLELLGQDTPYARPSNERFTVAVSKLELRLPVHETPGAAGTPPAVKTPCRARPTARIRRGLSRISRSRLIVRGVAARARCAGAPRITRVTVAVAKRVPRDARRPKARCAFLRANGRLSAPRRCGRPIVLRAGGTTRWRLRLPARLRAGRYRVSAQAVDGRRSRSRRSRITLVARPRGA